MAHAILMPKPGQMTEECVLTTWHKQEGDAVHKGDVLFEIETDKSIMEVESFDEGVLLKRLVEEGETVPVNAVCAYVGAAGEALPEAAAAPVGAVAAAGALATARPSPPRSPHRRRRPRPMPRPRPHPMHRRLAPSSRRSVGRAPDSRSARAPAGWRPSPASTRGPSPAAGPRGGSSSVTSGRPSPPRREVRRARRRRGRPRPGSPSGARASPSR